MKNIFMVIIVIITLVLLVKADGIGRVKFFTDPSCETCHKVDAYLQELKPAYSLKIEKLSVYEKENMERLFALEKTYNVSVSQVPVVEIEGIGILQGDAILRDLKELLEKGRTDTSTSDFSTRNFTIGAVALAGLLDGINPCAFATMVFLILFLFSINKSRREILGVALCFCAGVFIAYFAMGIGLRAVLSALYNVAAVKKYLNTVLAGVLIILAVWSFVDAYLFIKKGIVTLKLPESWKRYINHFIIIRSKYGSLYAGSIITGIIVSVIEIACTGQIYIPVIGYMIKEGKTSGYLYLTVYNLAFILPLVAVGIAVFFGMQKETVRTMLSKSVVKVKIAMGVLFVLLAILISMG